MYCGERPGLGHGDLDILVDAPVDVEAVLDLDVLVVAEERDAGHDAQLRALVVQPHAESGHAASTS